MERKDILVNLMVKNSSRNSCGGQCPNCGKKVREEVVRCICGQKIVFNKVTL